MIIFPKYQMCLKMLEHFLNGVGQSRAGGQVIFKGFLGLIGGAVDRKCYIFYHATL